MCIYVLHNDSAICLTSHCSFSLPVQSTLPLNFFKDDAVCSFLTSIIVLCQCSNAISELFVFVYTDKCNQNILLSVVACELDGLSYCTLM